MAKYQVQNKIDDADQYYGRVPHSDIALDFIGDYIEAEDQDEAIAIAMDYMAEKLQNGGFSVEIGDDSIAAKNTDGEVVVCYYSFTAKEQKTPRYAFIYGKTPLLYTSTAAATMMANGQIRLPKNTVRITKTKPLT